MPEPVGERARRISRRLIAALVVGVAAAACGSSPTAPSTTPGTPTSTRVSLTGATQTAAGAALTFVQIAGATITILDGPNAGQTATSSSSGAYRFDNLTVGNANLSASASGYQAGTGGVYINGANGLNFRLLANPKPLFTHSGFGSDVFDMPTSVTRVHIKGTYTTGCCANFIVYIGGQLTVNDLIGTSFGQTVSEGNYVSSGGVVTVTTATSAAWSFTEVR